MSTVAAAKASKTPSKWGRRKVSVATQVMTLLNHAKQGNIESISAATASRIQHKLVNGEPLTAEEQELLVDLCDEQIGSDTSAENIP